MQYQRPNCLFFLVYQMTQIWIGGPNATAKSLYGLRPFQETESINP